LAGVRKIDDRYWGLTMLPVPALRTLLVQRGVQPPNGLADAVLTGAVQFEMRLIPNALIGTSLLYVGQAGWTGKFGSLDYGTGGSTLSGPKRFTRAGCVPFEVTLVANRSGAANPAAAPNRPIAPGIHSPFQTSPAQTSGNTSGYRRKCEPLSHRK
jgi:hypothetical protein